MAKLLYTFLLTCTIAFGQRLNAPIFPIYTVGTIPAASTIPNVSVWVSDSLTGNCATGGGSTLILCRSISGSWVAQGATTASFNIGTPIGSGTSQYSLFIGPGSVLAQEATLGASRFGALLGDVTSPGASYTTTLATVNSGPGSCGDSTHVCVVTTNGKGLVTTQNSVAITSPGSGTVTNMDGALVNGQLIIGQGGSDVFVGDLIGDVTTSGSTATLISAGSVTTGKIATGAVGTAQLAAAAVNSSKQALVNTYRTCQFDNDTQSATVLTAAQLTGRCDVPFASTLNEIDVYASAGTSSVMIQRLRPNGGATANLLTGQLATATAGAYACATASPSSSCIAGITSSGTVTTSNTLLAAGDTIQISAATITGSPTWYHATVTFTVN
jgi:hypothetical protein